MNIEELLALASESLKDKNYDKAKSFYESILKIDSNNFQANTYLGILNINTASVDKGLRLLEIALVENPKRGEAWTNYIRYLMLAEDYKKAFEVIHKGKECGLSGDIISQYEVLCQLGNDYIILNNDVNIISLFLKDKFNEILELESSLTPKFSEYYSYQYLIGVCLLKVGLFELSIERLKKSIELKYDLVDSYRLLILLYSKVLDKENFRKYQKQYFYIKSKKIKTNSNIIKTIDIYLDKIQYQKGTSTFLDNAVLGQINGLNQEQVDYCKILEYSNNSRNNRFISYTERINLTKNRRQVNGLPFVLSQGTHSLIKWKEYDLYKTTNDMILYSMILNELKPEIIIEFGSGTGGSAVWMADMCKTLGFENHIFSYDIRKPNIDINNISFIEFDINNLESSNGLPFLSSIDEKRILVVEDAHVNLISVLTTVNLFLKEGDYLIIEDSGTKQREISKFMTNVSKKYKVDQFYLDFFGMNMTCSKDSIFRVFN